MRSELQTRPRPKMAPLPKRGAPGLSITRRDGESVVIDLADGSEIVVTLSQTRAGRARLHVAAPRNLPIRRSELARQPAA